MPIKPHLLGEAVSNTHGAHKAFVTLASRAMGTRGRL
jgi:hypothetical protein